jgi:hypothetical protein
MKENNLTFDQAYSKTQGGSAMTTVGFSVHAELAQ